MKFKIKTAYLSQNRGMKLYKAQGEKKINDVIKLCEAEILVVCVYIIKETGEK